MPPPKTPNPSQHDDHDMSTPPPTALTSQRHHPLSFAQRLNISSNPLTPQSQDGPPSPVRFATTTNAFGLAVSPTSSSSSSATPGNGHHTTSLALDTSPPTAGTVTTRRLRRPSMLSLAQTASFDSTGSQDQQTTLSDANAAASSSKDPFGRHSQPVQPIPRPLGFAGPGFLAHAIRRVSSTPVIPFETLKASTPPVPQVEVFEDSGSASPMDTETDDDPSSAHREPLRWMPSHLQSSAHRRKGKSRMADDIADPTPPPSAASSLHQPPFTGRPLPAPLLATLLSESSPLEHEMRSEARLQRHLASHPHALPLTPRAPRGSRGRFPEMVGGDDDDDDDDALPQRRASWARRTWMGRAGSSDSDSDDDMPMMQDLEGVNGAFAAGMDMDRPGSSSSSVGAPLDPSKPNSGWGAAGLKNARMSFGAAGQGMTMGGSPSGAVPSPASGLGLPGAFGGLGMGAGTGTPLGSPTIERLELVGSPNSVSSPGLMQYRESLGGSASVRPGKRKAQAEDRFDPYKRPRGTSPSFTSAFPMSPSRAPNAIPIPPSPGQHAPLYSSQLSTSNPSRRYTRPITSRSRQASPALSIGSASGVLSSSLTNNNGGRGSFSLGGALVPVGAGGREVATNGAQPLGGLGLLSLSKDAGGEARGRMEGVEEMRREEEAEDQEEAIEMIREDSRGSLGGPFGGMEED